MAHTLADVAGMIETERVIRRREGWPESDIISHLAEYEDELRDQAGYPDCSRCGTPDRSVRQYREGLLCVFCREDMVELRDDD